MFFANLAIPMRAQPFHFGHERYIKRLSLVCEKGVIFLNRKIDKDNPFPVNLRKKWIEDFLKKARILNIIVANRVGTSSTKRRLDEYGNFFHNHIDVVVVTTYETDQMYRGLGFKTFNHQNKRYDFWNSTKNDIFSKKLDGYGRVIRKNLREEKTCAGLISNSIELEARHFLKSNPL